MYRTVPVTCQAPHKVTNIIDTSNDQEKEFLPIVTLTSSVIHSQTQCYQKIFLTLYMSYSLSIT